MFDSNLFLSKLCVLCVYVSIYVWDYILCLNYFSYQGQLLLVV